MTINNQSIYDVRIITSGNDPIVGMVGKGLTEGFTLPSGNFSVRIERESSMDGVTAATNVTNSNTITVTDDGAGNLQTAVS